ncbi:MAG: FAD-dependent monooxygenase, partial [Microbacterium sp.]
VRAAMGARYEGAPGGRPNVNVTFRSTQLDGLIRHPPSVHYWSVNADFPGVVGPLDLGGTWWAISTGTESIDSDEHAAAIVRGLVGADIDVDVIATDPWQARLLLADRYRTGRLFVVGDAAHQNPPWGGHGFNTGVGDATNLGWKLAAVVNGWAPAELLDSYEAERQPIAAQTIEVAARNMATLSIDLAQAGLDDRALAEAIRAEKSREFHADGLVFGYGYGPGAARQTPDDRSYVPLCEPGNRLPHRLVGNTSLYDLLGPQFTVLGTGTAADALTDAARSRSIPVVHRELPGPTVLVRPDQHIAWTGEHLDDPGHVIDDALEGKM